MLWTSEVFSIHFFYASISQHFTGSAKANIKCNCFISKVKELLGKKGNPPALTLGTTILLTLCNFLIAEDINMIIKIEVVAHVLLTSVICSLLPVCAQEN